VDFGAGGGGESEVDMDRLAGLKAGGPVERDAVIEVASVADFALGEAFAREADDGAMDGFCWTAATNAEVRPPICRLECMQAKASVDPGPIGLNLRGGRTVMNSTTAGVPSACASRKRRPEDGVSDLLADTSQSPSVDPHQQELLALALLLALAPAMAHEPASRELARVGPNGDGRLADVEHLLPDLLDLLGRERRGNCGRMEAGVEEDLVGDPVAHSSAAKAKEESWSAGEIE
jgi:hypothetical protein